MTLTLSGNLLQTQNVNIVPYGARFAAQNQDITAHPTAEWTAQQFRMIIPGDQPHRFVIHDRDTIYSESVDATLAAMGLMTLKTPVRAPQANAFCERLFGTIRRECLDFIVPLNERHLIPERPLLDDAIGDSRDHWLPDGCRVAATAILGGLHHEYRLERKAT